MQIEEVRFELTFAERSERQAEMAHLIDQIDEVMARRKAHASELAAKEKDLNARLRVVKRAAQDGAEYREVEVIEVALPDTRQVEVRVKDTNKLARVRAMTSDEANALTSKEVKDAKKKQPELPLTPTAGPTPVRAGIRVTLEAAEWAALTDDQRRQVRHHAQLIDAVVTENEAGQVIVQVVPKPPVGKAFADLLVELKLHPAFDGVGEDPAPPAAVPPLVMGYQVLVRSALLKKLPSLERDRWTSLLSKHGLAPELVDGFLRLPVRPKDSGALMEVLAFFAQHDIAYDTTEEPLPASAVKTPEPAPATPEAPAADPAPKPRPTLEGKGIEDARESIVEPPPSRTVFIVAAGEYEALDFDGHSALEIDTGEELLDWILGAEGTTYESTPVSPAAAERVRAAIDGVGLTQTRRTVVGRPAPGRLIVSANRAVYDQLSIDAQEGLDEVEQPDGRFIPGGFDEAESGPAIHWTAPLAPVQVDALRKVADVHGLVLAVAHDTDWPCGREGCRALVQTIALGAGGLCNEHHDDRRRFAMVKSAEAKKAAKGTGAKATKKPREKKAARKPE